MQDSPDAFFIERLRQGRCVLFVGAGLSVACGLPGWEALLRQVAATADGAGQLVDAEGLDALLRKGRWLDAASVLRQWLGPQRFNSALLALLRNPSVRPGPTHRLLAGLRFRVIVTTNFDRLIEAAVGPGVPSVTHRDAEAVAQYLAEDTPFIYKVHGDIDRPDSIVLSSDEFARMVWGSPAFQRTMSALLLTSPVLFAGYSHADLDFDLMFREHVALFGQNHARRYALMQVVGPEDRAQVDVLRGKAIQVIPYRDHAEVPQFFERLAERVRDEVPAFSSTPPPGPPLALRSSTGLRRRLGPAPRPTAGRRQVVVIPGLLGSQLSVRRPLAGERRIWLNPWRLLLGDMAQLDLSRAPGGRRVQATDVRADFYGRLVERLVQQHEVLLFAYDWRLDHWESADQLRDFLAREADPGQPCDLVAHGEGGLVARAFIAEHRAAWDALQVDGRGGRLVMLGTPNHGSFQALMALTGKGELLRLLARLDLRHDLEQMRRIFASFPSLYQTLPSPLADAAWTALYRRESYGTLEVSQALLDAGAEFHRAIAGIVDPQRMWCVLGDDQPTVVAVEDPAQLSGPQQWAFTRRGDGSVAHGLATLSLDDRAVPAVLCGCPHADLASDARVADAVADYLQSGRTDRLPEFTPT